MTTKGAYMVNFHFTKYLFLPIFIALFFQIPLLHAYHSELQDLIVVQKVTIPAGEQVVVDYSLSQGDLVGWRLLLNEAFDLDALQDCPEKICAELVFSSSEESNESEESKKSAGGRYGVVVKSSADKEDFVLSNLSPVELTFEILHQENS